LPVVNAVNEGIWSIALFCIITGFIGPRFWLNTSLGFQNNKIMVIGFLIFSGINGYFHTMHILEKTDKTDLFLKCRLPLSFCLLTTTTYMCKPSFIDYDYMFVMILNLSKMSIICQICHIVGKEYQPIRMVNLGIFVIYLLTFLFAILGQDVKLMKHLIFAASMLDFINFTIMISKRMAHLLEIKVFTIKSANMSTQNIKSCINFGPEVEYTSDSHEFKKDSIHMPEDIDKDDTL
jgi:hypothetical protein